MSFSNPQLGHISGDVFHVDVDLENDDHATMHQKLLLL